MKITIFLIIVAVIFVAAWYFENHRRDALAKAAQRIGLTLDPGQQRLPQFVDDADFYLFSQGQPLIQNMMRGGRIGDRILVFNYTFEATQGFEGRREIPSLTDEGVILTHMQTVVAFHEITPLPHFDLSPNDKSKRTLNTDFRTVAFDEAPNFTQNYRLAAREEAKVRSLFNNDLLTHFANNPGWVVESRGDRVIFYQKDRRVDPELITEFIDQAHSLLDLLRSQKSR
ncbi:MAG: hypothetical protein AB2794_18095 [Candidatus Thiodiazotropha endolucinida]